MRSFVNTNYTCTVHSLNQKYVIEFLHKEVNYNQGIKTDKKYNNNSYIGGTNKKPLDMDLLIKGFLCLSIVHITNIPFKAHSTKPVCK